MENWPVFFAKEIPLMMVFQRNAAQVCFRIVQHANPAIPILSVNVILRHRVARRAGILREITVAKKVRTKVQRPNLSAEHGVMAVTQVFHPALHPARSPVMPLQEIMALRAIMPRGALPVEM